MILEDPLTMRPGFECSHSPPDVTTSEMMDTPDWVQFVLDSSMATEPGSRWVYCSPASHLLSAIIQETSVALLESSVQQVAAAPQPEPVPPLPGIAQQVSGQTYVLDDNPLGLLSASFTFQEGDTEALLLNLSFIDGNQAEWLIGLDSVFRISPGLYGLPVAVMGGWESDNVFVLQTDAMGKMQRDRMSMTFEDSLIAITIGGVPLTGRLVEQ
jgi:hypothetical protein